jgi:hypothetical protein
MTTSLFIRIAALAGLALGVAMVSSDREVAAQAPESRAATTHSQPFDDAHFLEWPLPAGQERYARISGARIKQAVDEITAISRQSRDAGEAYWGRISGTKYDEMTEQWVEDRFRAAGLQNVRRQWFDLPPQWFPTAWSLGATSGGKTLTFASARPGTRSAATPPGGLELEAVWVGLGTAADFIGRDVKGKLAVIHSVPLPGAIAHSASAYGAVRRAEENGAAAIVVALAIPGNVQTQLGGAGEVPMFSIGATDEDTLRRLMESGRPVRMKARLSTEMRSGLRDASVWGELPGTGREDVIVMAHHDAYFEGALNNASGMAVVVALGEYFAKVPASQRTRTIRLVASQGHHSGSFGTKWLADHKDTELANTALIINAEHVAVAQTALRGDVLRRANQPSALRWWIFGSHQLASITLNAFRTFGVAVYDGMEPDAPGDMSSVSRLAPSIQLMETPAFYQTDLDRPDIVPAGGLEAAARAFAHVISETDKFARKDLLIPAAGSSR